MKGNNLKYSIGSKINLISLQKEISTVGKRNNMFKFHISVDNLKCKQPFESKCINANSLLREITSVLSFANDFHKIIQTFVYVVIKN